MARKTKEELNEIKKQFGVDKIHSWSEYKTLKEDKYAYYLKYVLHKVEDRMDSIYTFSGSACHQVLEDFYTKKITYDNMINQYEDSLMEMNIAELKYDRTNAEKNEVIANKYEECVRHFFKNHNIVQCPHEVEKYLLIQISPEIIMQGYLDFIHTEPDGSVVITDYKTSTLYRGDKIQNESGQLLIYAEGIRQALNIPLEMIKCRWNFLKYVDVTVLQANGKWKSRIIERNAIGSKLVNSVSMWLKKSGYNESEIENYIADVSLENTLDKLPQEVREKFVIQDCYVYVSVTQENIDVLKEDIIITFETIDGDIKKYNEIKMKTGKEDNTIFWQEVTDKDEYRLNVLGGYSRRLHKPLDEYLKQKEMFSQVQENKSEDNENNEDSFIDFLSQL